MRSVFSSRKRYVTMMVENIPVYIPQIRKIQEKMNGEKERDGKQSNRRFYNATDRRFLLLDFCFKELMQNEMAEKDPYMQEAYDMLEQMSADERKRLEYEAREKAIRDYNTQMYSARKQGITDIITVMLKKGNTAETIASMTDVSLKTVKEIEKKILVTV